MRQKSVSPLASRKNLILAASCAALLASLAAAPSVSALNWDGGTDFWSTTVGHWDSNGVWVQGAAAIFGGTPGTVTLGEAISVGAMTFNVNGYTIDLAGKNLTQSGTTSFGGRSTILRASRSPTVVLRRPTR